MSTDTSDITGGRASTTRSAREQFYRGLFVACGVLSIATTLAIILTLTGDALSFFSDVSILDFLFGTNWSPQIAGEYGVSEAELTIAWLLSKETVHAIPKSTDTDHLRANFAAQSLSGDEADLERIDSLHEWRQQRVNNPDNPAWKWQLTDD